MNTLTSTVPSLELLSALCDGELSPQELTEALQACAQDPLVMAHWAGYQVIGNALRSQPDVVVTADTAFLDQFRHRVAREEGAPAIRIFSADVHPHAPTARVLPFTIPALVTLPATVDNKAAFAASNDAVFRWKLVAGFASLAAVSAIAWTAAGQWAQSEAPQLAQSSPEVQQILVVSPQGNMVRDARLEELLAAHKQMGGTSALQGPSGFLRNATFEMPRNAGR